ncbi:MAG TPA: response regulator transcription factor [Trichormus sp.]|jgi:DNA-binding response OmpR family regulator
MAKILLAEDDTQLAALVEDWLKSEHHVVDHVETGTDAVDLLNASRFDLLILDWNIPGVSGVEVCNEYRNQGGTSPVLMLTGRDKIEDKEEGLDAGADDYLTKPFHLRELSARIRALLRRPPDMASNVIEHGRLVLDVSACRLLKDGQPIELFPKELALLEFLMRHPNKVFSIEALQERVWSADSEASPETIRVHIARLRSKIENEGEKQLLRTVHRQGYMLDLND